MSLVARRRFISLQVARAVSRGAEEFFIAFGIEFNRTHAIAVPLPADDTTHVWHNAWRTSR